MCIRNTGFDVLFGDTRIGFEQVFHVFTIGQFFQNQFYWNARALDYGFAKHDFWIGHNSFLPSVFHADKFWTKVNVFSNTFLGKGFEILILLTPRLSYVVEKAPPQLYLEILVLIP